MRIDVIDAVRRDTGGLQRIHHCPATTLALGCHAGHVKSIPAHAVADYLGQNLGSSRFSELELFQNQDAGAFPNDEAIAVAIPRPAGTGGIFISG